VRADGFAGGFLLPKKYNMLEIKKEFKKLIPPLTAEEFKQLEENCLNEGIRESILTWNGFIIDGHNRYEIATKWNLDYQTKSKHFASEQDVIEWMILNQLGRRNLSKDQKKYLIALELESVFSERAKESYKENVGRPSKLSQKSDTIKVDTKKELAKVANVSHDTIAKVKVIESQAIEEVKEKLRTGEVSIKPIKKLKKEKQKHISKK
jgi:hypothetical protein